MREEIEMRPTAEQTKAIDAFATGENMTIEAGAGTGKTSTLRAMSAEAPNRRGLYIAYNTAIARESAASFPANVECRTAHSVAYRWTAAQWGGALRERLNAPRVPVRQTARILNSNEPLRVNDELMLAPERIASIAMQTVQRWCYSSDTEITSKHVPSVNRIDDDGSRNELAAVVVPMARAAWRDLCKPHGSLRFVHDHYLKLWALASPKLSYDFVLVDEAQDSNGVVTGVVKDQVTQVVAVGDRCQAIYGWRGAQDAMDSFGSKHHVFLTQSFRFGPAIADEANKWLEVLESELRLRGTETISSRIAEVADARAVLCRTNAEAISTVIGCHAAGTKVALVGGGREVVSFARAAGELMDKGSTSHPELFPFESWGMVKEYVEEAHDGGELKVLVKLIDEYSPSGVISAIEQCVSDENKAEVTVSTAHKAKGREWSSVRIADDFSQDDENLEISNEEAMLAYVAVTRARDVLDRGGLSWIDKLLEGSSNGDEGGAPAPSSGTDTKPIGKLDQLIMDAVERTSV